jgi:hypothetical protein
MKKNLALLLLFARSARPRKLKTIRMSWPSDSAVSPRSHRAILQVWAPDRA